MPRRTRKYRGGNDVESQIMQSITNTKHDMKNRSFELAFSFKGLNYSTIFHLKYKRSTLRLYNNCIDLMLMETNDTYELDSSIKKNTSEPACFTPRLESIISPIKITSIDVLQTLSTKIKLILYKHKYINNITIVDHARINMIHMLPYRVLRGEPSVYEKYGYVSKELNRFRESVLPNATWNHIISLDKYYILHNKEYINLIEKYNKYKYDDWKIQHISDLLKNIPFEEESLTHLSTNIMLVLYGLGFLLSDLTYFILDPSSMAWKEWDSVLEFKEYKEISQNGGKSNKKTRKYIS